ncbi:MAG: FAD-binding oxidoreductase [Pseudomonadota bacterium]
MASRDITVLGAGVFGLAVARECLRRGAGVLVIDPKGPGGGASGGVVGALAPHTPEGWTPFKAFQRDALLLARTYWPEIETASGLATGYRRSGRIQPLARETDLERARAREKAAAELWQGAATWSVTPDAPGWAPISPVGHWVEDTLSAQLDPARAVVALAQAIELEGGTIRREGEPQGVVIHATGWEGLRALGADLGREMGGGVKGQAAILDASPGEIPQIYADGLHVVTHGPGRVAIGSTSEWDFQDPEATDNALDDVVARARAAVPFLKDAPVVARWAGVRPRAVKGRPLVGPWPGRAGHYVANGGFKIGFALAPALAPILADLVFDGVDRIPEEFRLGERAPMTQRPRGDFP